MEITVDIPREYNLDLTMYPSFTLTLFRKIGPNQYVKVFGEYRGLKITQYGDKLRVKYNDDLKLRFIKNITGLWFDLDSYIKLLGRGVREKIEDIVNNYYGVRVSIDDLDKWMIFIAVFLSRHTDYYTNVIKWCSRIFSSVNSPYEINRESIYRVGSSYQLKQLSDVIHNYVYNVFRIEDKLSPIIIKRELLRIRFVGPKVANAYLLFTRRAMWITPCDIHYIRLIKKLNLLDGPFAQPRKNLCLEYYGNCKNCPLSNLCIEYRSIMEYRFLSGWLQTVSYIHDRIYCKASRCVKCPLKGICIK